MLRIFITHIVPQNEVLKYNLSVAASNFSHNLIDGRVFSKVYSILPTFIYGYIEKVDDMVIYSALRRFHIFNKIAPIVENISLYRKIPHKASIWYYNCTILNAILIILLKLLKPSVKQQMIILDYTPSSKLINRFYLWLANKMDGTIRLADSPLFTVKNSICLPGIVPMDGVSYPKIKTVTNEFLISGALGDNISMLPMLLDAFSKMPKMTLHITGKAPDLKLIEEYTSKCNNIIYHGMVEYKEYLEILHDTPFLLSTRNPKYPENQCNFPSKIIEALYHNRIIVSSLHYEQLNGIRYFEVATKVEDFITDVKRMTSMPQEKILQYANQADIVKKRFNVAVWKQTMEKIEHKLLI